MSEHLDAIAEAVHDAWMETKRSQGVTSRPSEWGEEQMVPYAQLSERAKDLDRSTVRAVLNVLASTGLRLIPSGRCRACAAGHPLECEHPSGRICLTPETGVSQIKET